MNEISRLYLLCCLTFGGCVTSEPEGKDDDPATETTAQAVELRTHYDRKDFGGYLFSHAFNYVTQDPQTDPQIDPHAGDCSPGTIHTAAPDWQWNSNQGGFCVFDGWSGGESNLHDCRAKVTGSTSGGGFGGTCQVWVHEQPEPVPNSLAYSATNTNSAQVRTTDIVIALAAGQTLTIGTCGVAGSSFNGDTYIRMFNSSGNLVKESDDACNGLGSNIVYTAPPQKDTFTIRAGCYANTGCSGRVAWTL